MYHILAQLLACFVNVVQIYVTVAMYVSKTLHDLRCVSARTQWLVSWVYD